jgi:hypothetical protein
MKIWKKSSSLNFNRPFPIVIPYYGPITHGTGWQSWPRHRQYYSLWYSSESLRYFLGHTEICLNHFQLCSLYNTFSHLIHCHIPTHMMHLKTPESYPGDCQFESWPWNEQGFYGLHQSFQTVVGSPLKQTMYGSVHISHNCPAIFIWHYVTSAGNMAL